MPLYRLRRFEQRRLADLGVDPRRVSDRRIRELVRPPSTTWYSSSASVSTYGRRRPDRPRHSRRDDCTERRVRLQAGLERDEVAAPSASRKRLPPLPDTGRGHGRSSITRAVVRQRAAEGDLVRVLEVAADGQAAGQARHPHAVAQPVGEVRRRRLAGHVRVRREHDLLDAARSTRRSSPSMRRCSARPRRAARARRRARGRGRGTRASARARGRGRPAARPRRRRCGRGADRCRSRRPPPR